MAQGFDAAADVYERARPDYPSEALEWIADELELVTGAYVVDLAAGTGKLTRQLLALGLRVTAVEPVRGMREVLTRVLPNVDAIEGTAESIPLEAGAVDAVTVAQAFHWFDAERALAEIHRVLRPGGGVALIWNVRDGSDPLQEAYAALIRPYRGDYPEPHGESEYFSASPLASPLFERYEQRTFRHVQLLDADGLVARAASVSFIAKLPVEERGELLERVRAIALAGQFEFPYLTKVFTARSR
jgi:SAM-dependent methyltransferase